MTLLHCFMFVVYILLHHSFIYTILPPVRRVAETEGPPEGSVHLLSPFGEPPTLTADGFTLFPDIIPGDIFLFNLADNILMLFQQLLFAGIVRREKGHHPSF